MAIKCVELSDGWREGGRERGRMSDWIDED